MGIQHQLLVGPAPTAPPTAPLSRGGGGLHLPPGATASAGGGGRGVEVAAGVDPEQGHCHNTFFSVRPCVNQDFTLETPQGQGPGHRPSPPSHRGKAPEFLEFPVSYAVVVFSGAVLLLE